MAKIIVDTGPIVALLSPQDRWHGWSVDQFRIAPAPLYTCEAVISEASYLVRRHSKGNEVLIGLLRQGVIEIGFELQREITVIDRLLRKYSSVPMSLADACLVRMSELYTGSEICTLDADFRVYRRNNRQVIPVRGPE